MLVTHIYIYNSLMLISLENDPSDNFKAGEMNILCLVNKSGAVVEQNCEQRDLSENS